MMFIVFFLLAWAIIGSLVAVSNYLDRQRTRRAQEVSAQRAFDEMRDRRDRQRRQRYASRYR